MAELIVFTFLAAIAATYQVLPKHKQFRIRFNLWTRLRLGFIILMLTLIVVAYLGSIYLQDTKHEEIAIITSFGSVSVTPFVIEVVQLIAVFGIVLLFAIVFLKPSVRIKNGDNLLTILRSLYNREDYSTLVDVISDNYHPLINHPKKPRHPESYMATLIRAHQDEYQAISGWKQKMRNFVRLVKYHIGRIKYRMNNTAEDVSAQTESLLLDSKFAAVYPILAPELGIRIIKDDSLDKFSQRDVVHQYLQTLVKSENSLLHRDIKRNTASRGPYRYQIDEENRIVHALFSDCEKAEELDVYKPIGDATRKVLREQKRKEYDEYNDLQLTSSQLSEDNYFRDPIFIAIQFFDVMVKEAFHQKISWHMWLYYYETFTQEICRNYRITKYSDPTAEWPNDYSRFLYEMTNNMVDWVRAIEEIDQVNDSNQFPGQHMEDVSHTPPYGDGANRVWDGEIVYEQDKNHSESNSKYEDYIRLNNIDTNRGHGANIPKASVICLISCHSEIITTEAIPTQFKSYLTEQILLCGLELGKHPEGTLPRKYSNLMIHCIEENLGGRKSGHDYRRELQQVYRDVRHELVVHESAGPGGFVDEMDEIMN